jgi:hypothetical protein
MKTCPTCSRTYADALRFCLEDGTTLVRAEQGAGPTMTMPAQPAFQPPPPPPTLQMTVKPSMSVGGTLTRAFFAPGRTFDSFRELVMFSPAAVRFLIAAAIILIAVVAYNAIFLASIGSEQIARASMEVSPQAAKMSPDVKERALQMQQSPTFQGFTLIMRFGLLILFTLASFFLGALIYWLGALLMKSKIKYLQALLVWTYASFPVVVIWLLANTIVLLVWPPSTNMAIVTGASGVIHANLGALFDVKSLPIPVYVVALSAFDLFELYGLALAMLGLRKVARIPWIGSFGIVIFVWLIGVMWRISTAGVVSAFMK